MNITIKKIDFEKIIEWVTETLKSFSEIENKLLKLETNYSDMLLNSIIKPIFRLTDSAIKFNFKEVSKASTVLEQVLFSIKHDKPESSSEIFDTLLKAIDTLNNSFNEINNSLNSIDISIMQEDEFTIELSKNPMDEIAALFKIEEQIPKTIDEKLQKNKIVLNKDLLQQFLIEANENLVNIEQNLLEIENKKDDLSIINSIFRFLHSLKGGSALILSTAETDIPKNYSLPVFRDLAHASETILQKIRDGKIKIDDLIITNLFTTLDYLKLLIQQIQNYEYADDSVSQFLIDLKKIPKINTDEDDQSVKVSGKPPDINETRIEAFLNIAKQSINSIEDCHNRIKENGLKPDPKTIEKYLRSIKNLFSSAKYQNYKGLLTILEQVGEILTSLKEGRAIFDKMIWEILEESLSTIKNDVKSIISPKDFLPDETSTPIIINQVTSDLDSIKVRTIDTKDSENQFSRIPKVMESTNTIRVSYEKIDKLMNLIGELIVAKNMFSHISRKLFIEYNMPNIGKEVKDIGSMINRVSDDLQNTIMDVRMIPIRYVFQKFPRLVRDISKTTGKEVNLVLEGENTHLDKTIIEKINDPLIHLVRNSVDHGIETVQERQTKGKKSVGTIKLKSEIRGSNVLITISDDGKGISIEEIKKKAIEKNLISKDKAKLLTQQEIFDFMFLPGFSTAKDITEFSGRGVGLDVVKTNILSINGSVDISSEINKGTTVTLIMPLTLLISKGLIIEICKESFVVPLEFIEETVKIPLSRIHKYKNYYISEIRGEIINLIPLNQIFEFENDSTFNDNLTKKDIIKVIILNIYGQRAGLLVDDFSNEQEIVIKPLNYDLIKVGGISGATIMGDGNVVLILNPVEILQLMFKKMSASKNN